MAVTVFVCVSITDTVLLSMFVIYRYGPAAVAFADEAIKIRVTTIKMQARGRIILFNELSIIDTPFLRATLFEQASELQVLNQFSDSSS